MKTKISLLTASALLISCVSASDNDRTVNDEKWQPKGVQSASFVTNSSTNQAASFCETSDMRRKVIDGNDHNDAVRIMVVEDADTGSRVLSEVEIDCRDYFLRKSLAPAQPQIIQSSTATIVHVDSPEPKTRKKNLGYTYIVQKGDTVWDIAREHCTTAKDISRLNGLGRGNVIDIGQRLKLPDEECN